MYPGEGAIEYARQLTEGMTQAEAAIVISKLRAQLPGDKRIKFCAVCGFPFRDKTRPCNAVVCSLACKTVRKTAQKAEQRAKKAEENPPKPKKAKKYDEQSYLLRLWRHEKPFNPDKLERIQAARERYEQMGGRRKPIREIDY
ncbi:hypothetical protein [Paenibacillus sp. J22TS3]|uniref:hypothetical protein n=1 Tax=Paenibacillus sp. J22TS3 TaxID=2807192 RepID=UPI001B1F368C|nr:hypothetical protein [Paenibacillus sp. J22TS3]GIP21054.1 hypothetical protein J22TS3_13290 [Paenibacillus sp. J22TS3]